MLQDGVPTRYLNDASQILDRTVDGSEPELLAATREIVTEWAGAETARVSVVSGGITNQLYRLDAEERPTVLVRLYGANTEVIIDRETENALFAKLSETGFGPTYYGRFTNGRVEGFLHGFEALEPDQMSDPHLRKLIAYRLAELHDIAPLSAEPQLWQTLQRWMGIAVDLNLLDLTEARATLDELQSTFANDLLPNALPAAVRPVLSHNDLLSGNILYHRDKDEVRFIDYEYGACSYAAFDLANHFCEYAGFDADFERGFPQRDVREDVISHYLGGAPHSEVEAFSDLVDFMVLADHLWWGTWAVVQARYSPIDFDYLGYAKLRLEGLSLHRRTLKEGR